MFVLYVGVGALYSLETQEKFPRFPLIVGKENWFGILPIKLLKLLLINLLIFVFKCQTAPFYYIYFYLYNNYNFKNTFNKYLI